MKALMIAGDRSGSGKTSITLALSSILSRSMAVQTFKVGMDYIDPSYLTGVTGRPCRNLDSFVLSDDEIRQIYAHGSNGADMVIVEGVRGLFEGAEALGDSGSSASIAKSLDLPVVLVVSARSITRSAAAIVKGFQAFDPDVKIRGVILNNVAGGKHIEKASTAIEHYCGIPVIGAIPRQPEMELTMRHLGLVPYLEGKDHPSFRERIDSVTSMIGDHVDMERFCSLAETRDVPASPQQVFSPGGTKGVKIGVALDEAFNFYYADLFDILPACGAEYVTFSPLHDSLPDADGYIIGGGYPELFLPGLEENAAMREDIKKAAAGDFPIYAECGGLMYLTDSMVLREGWQGRKREESYRMCGVYDGSTRMPARRVVSYVEGTSDPAGPMGPGRFRGHEFHYSEVKLNTGTSFAYTLSRGQGIAGNLDGALSGMTLGSYTHLHPVSSREMFAHFIGCCRGESISR
ncbi:MAG TPA: Ni-sirohydrochlorin a,c-diamide synthase [Methanoregulaceae archaeon]|nr:Ni-sirohydrochlorin a,c-diamide synthase [Methanoregulaceae archaeon]